MVRRGQLRPTLNVNLSQRLAMTPSLLQKIELLTLNHLELSERLQQELSENPVLEESSAPDEESADRPEAESEKSAEADSGLEDDFDYEYFFEEYLSSNSGPIRPEFEAADERPSFDLFLASSASLSDHLNWQLNLSEVEPELSEIAYFIIGNINDRGYLSVTVEEIAASLEVSFDEVESALKVVQEMDPIGVGARDLRECLLLQLRAGGYSGTLSESLVKDHLELLEAKRYSELAKTLRCDEAEIQEALGVIRYLSPNPGEKYSRGKPVYIQPDIYIRKVNGDYQVVMNDDGLPRLRVSRLYRSLLKDGQSSKETKSYIRERCRSAMELLKSVDQRQQTIYRVCNTIVERQVEFLERGLNQLKPMLIKDVAEELGVHSSTISRVVSNKYAHTPQGVIELRRFFTVGIESAGGEIISVAMVKEAIKTIIVDENPRKPFSDQEITQTLNDRGIQITRRTVAKYRDQMNIAGSRQRREKT